MKTNVVEKQEFFGPHFVSYGKAPPAFHMEYPDIVDRSTFSPNSSLQDLQDTDSASSGLYDYPTGEVKDPVNPVLIAIRSGKLEQPDIDKLMSALEEVTKSQIDSDEKREAQKSLDALNELRQEAVDNALGIDKSASKSSE